MELRPALLPPSVPSERLAELSRQADRIVGLLDRGEPVEREIAAFNAATGHACDRADFAAFAGAEDAEDFVLRALLPPPPRLPDITRAELIEIVRRIREHAGETDHYLALFAANVPHPAAGDLIFWPPPHLANASDAEIVDAALTHTGR